MTKRFGFFLFALLAPALAAADINTNVVSVGTGATLIVAARSGRASITIVNTAQTVSLCVSGAATVSTSSGVCLPAVAGASITLSTAVAIYGVWSDAGTHPVSFVETF